MYKWIDHLLYPLSLSISLNNNNSHSFSLSLQFQTYARFDRNKLNLIRRYLHSLHSLSLSSSSAFTALPISLSYESHGTNRRNRTKFIHPLFIRFIGLFEVYVYTGRTVGVVAKLRNARFQRRGNVFQPIFNRYRVVYWRFVNPRFANQNDFRKEEGRRFRTHKGA